MTRPCTPYENLRRTCIESGGEGHPQHRVPSRGCPQKRRGWCPGSAVCSSTPDAFPAPSPSPPIAWKPFFRFCLPLSRTRSLDAGPGPHKLFWRGGAVGSSRRMLGTISPGPQHAVQDACLPWNQQPGRGVSTSYVAQRCASWVARGAASARDVANSSWCTSMTHSLSRRWRRAGVSGWHVWGPSRPCGVAWYLARSPIGARSIMCGIPAAAAARALGAWAEDWRGLEVWGLGCRWVEQGCTTRQLWERIVHVAALEEGCSRLMRERAHLAPRGLCHAALARASSSVGARCGALPTRGTW